jgi:hypothetical protein
LALRGEIINRLLLSVIQRSRSLEHVHVVARISWIRVMSWNLRACRPPTQRYSWHLLQMSLHVKVPVCFNFFNFHPVNIEHIILTNRRAVQTPVILAPGPAPAVKTPAPAS